MKTMKKYAIITSFVLASAGAAFNLSNKYINHNAENKLVEASEISKTVTSKTVTKSSDDYQKRFYHSHYKQKKDVTKCLEALSSTPPHDLEACSRVIRDAYPTHNFDMNSETACHYMANVIQQNYFNEFADTGIIIGYHREFVGDGYTTVLIGENLLKLFDKNCVHGKFADVPFTPMMSASESVQYAKRQALEDLKFLKWLMTDEAYQERELNWLEALEPERFRAASEAYAKNTK